MNQSKFSFESENLVVDYITLSLKNLSGLEFEISQYLFRCLQFNCYKSLNKRTQQTLLENIDNQAKVTFRSEMKEKSKIQIQFAGKNAKKFYQLITLKKVNWNIFKKYQVTISRFDICYVRPHSDYFSDEELNQFFSACQKKLLPQYNNKRNVSFSQKKGKLLTINNRRGAKYYYRIYTKGLGPLRFELEFKQPKFFERYILDHKFSEFENYVTNYFFNYSSKIVVYTFQYTDWMLHYFRKNRKNFKNTDNYLATTYLIKQKFKEFHQQESYFRLLQLLTFIKSLKMKRVPGWKKNSYVATFYLVDFINFSESKQRKVDTYTRNKVIEFFNHIFEINLNYKIYFQDESVFWARAIENIFIKKQGRSWLIEICISEQLYKLQYPFLLSPVFLTYQSRDELRLKLELIQSLSNPNLKKEFHTEQFFQELKKAKKSFIDLKRLLITLLNQLYKSGIIYSKIKIIFKNGETQLTQIKNLKTITVTKSKVLILYEQHKQINSDNYEE